jgi:putative membrane protein
MSPRQNPRLSIISLALGFGLIAASGVCHAQGTASSSSSAATTGARGGSSASGQGMTASRSATGANAAGANSLAGGDKAFVQKAAVGGMAEVELGKLAQQKGSNDQVKQFGTHMVEDHSKANSELKQIASSKGVTLPTDLDAAHKNKMAKMQKLSGAQFDRAYMAEMVADHKKDVADFRKQSTSGKDSDLKGFAAKTLPTLEDHLKMAQSTHAAVKGGKASASR